jgi:uncharacterized protein (TIGR00251 family)
VTLTVRLTPRGGRNRIDGIGTADGRSCLLVRVSAPPVEGAANAALVSCLAEALGLPRSAIRVISGHKARLKTVHIEGSDVTARLDALACGMVR